MRSRSLRNLMQNGGRLHRADGGSTNPYEDAAQREQKYWEGYSATHDPSDKYEDVDTSSLAGANQKQGSSGNYGKQFSDDYHNFVGSDQSASNAIRNQAIRTPIGNGRPGFDAQAMRDRAAAKAAGRQAPRVDRRSDAYKQAAQDQNDDYREQSMDETQRDKRRAGAFQNEMHLQRVKDNSDAQAADLTRHGYKQGEDGNWNRSVWDQMQDQNPGLTKAFGWIPGAKQGSEAAARGDVGGMMSAGKDAFTGSTGAAVDTAGRAALGDKNYEAAKQMAGHKRGGRIASPVNTGKRSPNLSLRYADGGRTWIADATANKGALHKALGVPKGKKIPNAKLEKAEHSRSPLMRKRATLAETLKGFHKD